MDNLATWLTLSLAVKRGFFGRSTHFVATFRNTDSVSHDLGFWHLSFKAEYLGLGFYDLDNKRVWPTSAATDRLAPHRGPGRVLHPNGEWRLRLTGVLKNGELKFSRTTYAIDQGKTLRVEFRYGDVVSNPVWWKT